MSSPTYGASILEWICQTHEGSLDFVKVTSIVENLTGNKPQTLEMQIRAGHTPPNVLVVFPGVATKVMSRYERTACERVLTRKSQPFQGCATIDAINERTTDGCPGGGLDSSIPLLAEFTIANIDSERMALYAAPQAQTGKYRIAFQASRRMQGGICGALGTILNHAWRCAVHPQQLPKATEEAEVAAFDFLEADEQFAEALEP